MGLFLNQRFAVFGVRLMLGLAVFAGGFTSVAQADIQNSNDYFSRYIGQRYQGDNVLQVRQLLGLNGREFDGRRVEYIALRASTAAGRGQAWLMINDTNVGYSQVVGQRPSDYFFYPDSNRNVLGQDIRGIQIGMRGNFDVESIAVKLSPGYGNGRDYIEVQVNQRYQGRNALPLRQMLGIGGRFRGSEVEYIVMTASTDAGRGDAQLLVDGYTTGYSQNVGTYMQDYFFYLDSYRNRIDQDFSRLEMALQGRFNVAKIGIKFRGRGPGPGPGPGPRPEPVEEVVSARISMSFDGNNQMDIRQILNLDGRFAGRRIEMVSMTASTAGGRGQAVLVINGVETGPAQQVGNDLASYDFYGNGQPLNLLQMNLRGRFFVDTITVRFSR